MIDIVRTMCYCINEEVQRMNANINIRTTSELKNNANQVLRLMGLDMSTAVNLF